MVLKKKHNKQLKRNRQLKEEKKQRDEPEIDFDTSAYVIYNRLEMTYPCLSFDIIPDSVDYDKDRVKQFPLSLRLVAGAQTPPHVENNYIYVMKVENIKPLKQEDEEDNSEDESDEESQRDSLPSLTSVRVSHKGCVNRIRTKLYSGRTLAASWSDRGKVHIYDLTVPIQAVSDQKSIKTYVAQKVEPKPTFTFGGHLSEGYAVDWSGLVPGTLATGDCKKSIHVWKMKNQSDWLVDQQPLVGHQDSVEDLKWSPDDENILLSCSVDKSIRLWDLRNKTLDRCVANVPECHKSDVNVVDWNRICKQFIVSGGDDGFVRVWDTRMLKSNERVINSVAQFDYHKKPISSVEWNPNDDTVMAVASEDDRLTIWDLAVEKDDEESEAKDIKMDTDEVSESDEKGETNDSNDEDELDEELDEGVDYKELKQIPEQMLFLHQGQAEIKELHWHPQYEGLIISTAINGINIFKTISA